MGRSTNLLWTVLPSIAIVAALFVAFSYTSHFVKRFLDEGQVQDQVLVRSIDGVVELPKPALEQPPPPSPEAVMEAHRRALEAERAAQRAEHSRPEPVYIPEIESDDTIKLEPVEVAPLAVPGFVEDGVH